MHLSPGPSFNIHQVNATGKAKTELGSLHQKQIQELQEVRFPRSALASFHRINIDAAAELRSYSTAAERLEGASKYPMLAELDTCIDVANTVISANRTAKREEDKVQANQIALHAVDYLVGATKYVQLRDFSLPIVLELFKTETLSDNARLAILRGLSDAVRDSSPWMGASWKILSESMKDYVALKGDTDDFALLIQESPFVIGDKSMRSLLAFSLYVNGIMEGKRQFPTLPLRYCSFSMPPRPDRSSLDTELII